MKKRTKKYNPDKAYQKDPHGTVEDIAIFQLPGQFCSFVNMKTLQLIRPRKGRILTPLLRTFTRAEYEWTVAAIVFRINDKGEKALDVHHLAPPFPCKADQIADAVKDKHYEMINKTPTEEFICAGWLATPRDEYHSSVVLLNLFDSLGVWEEYVTNNGNKLKGK